MTLTEFEQNTIESITITRNMSDLHGLLIETKDGSKYHFMVTDQMLEDLCV